MATLYCIPEGGRYPVHSLTEPPQWWDTAGTPAFNNQVNDPRWAGSLKTGYGSGAAEQVAFRALRYTFTTATSTDTYLYLSWHVKVDPENTVHPNNFIQVGFNPSGGAPSAAQPAVIIKIGLATTASGGVTAGGSGSYTVSAIQKQSAIGNWTAVPNTDLNTWTWIKQRARVWASGAGTAAATWAIQMIVPVKAPPNGLNLGSTFGMCYYVQVYASTVGTIPYKWPTTIADPPTAAGINPAATDFLPCTLGTPVPPDTCYATGITLPVAHIGTKNVMDPNPPHLQNPQLIKFTAGQTTQFFARPVNNDPAATAIIPSGTIKADFRLANWGSQVTNPAHPAVWKSITAEGNLIDHPEMKPGGTPGNQQEILLDWAPTVAQETFYQNNRHQCMLVELSAPGLTFIDSSVATNMDFVRGSLFRRKAEISIRGLAPISPQPRDVYLFIEARNMPAQMDEETWRKYEVAKGLITELFPRDPEHEYIPPDRTAELERFEQYMPTYRCHVYHDTGNRMDVDGTMYPILEPQQSFGYYVWHEGDLIGWDLRLRGAQKIAENTYLIRVPNDSFVDVETVIHAVQDGEPREPEEKIELRPDYRVMQEGCFGWFYLVMGFIVEVVQRLSKSRP